MSSSVLEQQIDEDRGFVGGVADLLGILDGPSQRIDGRLGGGQELVGLVEISLVESRDSLGPAFFGDQGVFLPSISPVPPRDRRDHEQSGTRRKISAGAWAARRLGPRLDGCRLERFGQAWACRRGRPAPAARFPAGAIAPCRVGRAFLDASRPIRRGRGRAASTGFAGVGHAAHRGVPRRAALRSASSPPRPASGGPAISTSSGMVRHDDGAAAAGRRGLGRLVVPDDLGVGPRLDSHRRPRPRHCAGSVSSTGPSSTHRSPIPPAFGVAGRAGATGSGSGLRGKTKTPSPQAGQRSA